MARLRHLRSLRSQVAELQSAIVGWHLEGPFLSAEPGFHGAHNPALMRNPTSEDIHELRKMTDNDPCLLTLSPERPGAINRVLSPDSIYYTTDAMSAAGAPPGRYKLGKMDLEVGPDQIVRQPGKPLFAGSALRPIEGVFRAAQMLGCSWQEAWLRFSEAPARLMGLRHELAVGQPADFCVLRVAERNQLLDLEVHGKTRSERNL